jgi:hypothetical protein
MQISNNKSKSLSYICTHIVNVIFKYILHVKNTKDLSNNNVGVSNYKKTHYGCYEIVKNSGLHIHIKNLICDEFIMKIVRSSFFHRFVHFAHKYHTIKTCLTHI